MKQVKPTFAQAPQTRVACTIALLPAHCFLPIQVVANIDKTIAAIEASTDEPKLISLQDFIANTSKDNPEKYGDRNHEKE